MAATLDLTAIRGSHSRITSSNRIVVFRNTTEVRGSQDIIRLGVSTEPQREPGGSPGMRSWVQTVPVRLGFRRAEAVFVQPLVASRCDHRSYAYEMIPSRGIV